MNNQQPPESGRIDLSGREQPKPRIWALTCPFTKKGHPNVGSFGSTVRPVVIIPMATWTQLCKDIPALGATQFEVGAFDE